jgi:hypothetical protein
MALNVNKLPKKEGGKGKAELLEEGNYPARVVQIVDLGLQPGMVYMGNQKPPAHKIRVTYELVSEFMKNEDGTDNEDAPRWLSEDFPLFGLGADRAKSTIRYNALDPKHEHEGDWAALLDTPCLVTVVNNVSKSNGNTYNNVGLVSQPMKGMETPPLKHEPIAFDLDNPDLDVFNSLPEWLRDDIIGNLEFNASPLQVALGIEAGPVDPDPEPEAEGEDDDDTPF